MCGILVAIGKNSETFVKENIKVLEHRGPDSVGFYSQGEFSFGFTRLAINDITSSGNQPFDTGNILSLTNGEIYNFIELKEKYKIKFVGKSDTEIISHLFELIREDIIDELDGFFSSVIFDKNNKKLFCMRDYIGKKGLFLVKCGELIVITSELKAVSDYENFTILPKGICEIDTKNCEYMIIKQHSIRLESNTNLELKDVLIDAVKKRIPCNNSPFGVFLSGGLDSSIVACITEQYSKDAIYYVLADGDHNSLETDLFYVNILANDLNLKNVRIIHVPDNELLEELIPKIVYTTESYNPSIISNGLCTYLLAAEARKDGIKVVLTGEGADELFGGYHFFYNHDSIWKITRDNLISDMYYTELRRLDLTTMAHSIEARCPFLDIKVFAFSESLQYEDLYAKLNGLHINKFTLRKAFQDLLPTEICYRKKTSFDVGSGIRKYVVDFLTKNGKDEKDELLSIWSRFFKYKKNMYFDSYPVFDAIISKRGRAHKL